MAFSVIIALCAAVAGMVSFGVALDMDEEAKKRFDEANEIVNNAYAGYEDKEEKCVQLVNEYEERKKKVWETTMKEFYMVYSKIKNIKITPPGDISEKIIFDLDRKLLSGVQEDIELVTIKSGLGGAAGGLAAGTLITTISTAGFVSLIISPAFLMAGISSGLTAEENMDKANLAWAKAKAIAAELEAKNIFLDAVAEKAMIMRQLLDDIDNRIKKYIELCTGIIEKKGMNIDYWREEELGTFGACRALVTVLNHLLNTCIISEEGRISEESPEAYNEALERFSLATIA